MFQKSVFTICKFNNINPYKWWETINVKYLWH